MNRVSTTVKDAFTGAIERPTSHIAALAVLGALAWVAHEGIAAWVPGGLGTALTILFLAVAVLQWLGLGRKEACDTQRDTERSDAVITQAWIFGAIETVLYAAGGLALLAKEQVPVYTWWGVALAVVAAATCALVNFRIKWVSCDPVSGKAFAGPTGGQRVHDVMFTQQAPALPAPDFVPGDTARYTWDDGIVDFEQALRRRGERTVNELDPRLATSATRDAGERFKLWKKREQRRRQRAATVEQQQALRRDIDEAMDLDRVERKRAAA
ncbi:MAG: hypothetical protein QM773_13770 [Hyphomonadaceae bacterium]